MSQDWRPIESYEGRFEDVLLFDPEDEWKFGVGDYDDIDGRWYWNRDWKVPCSPSHWMPLPSAPLASDNGHSHKPD